MQTIEQIQEEIIEEFESFSDWMEKYDYIIQLGKDLPLIDEQWKTDEYLIKGCQSKVWLHAEHREGKVFFTADSDAIITKGLVSLLVSVLSGHEAQKIAEANIYFIDSIGLKSHLSPTRSNGFASMLRQMKNYAVAFAAQQKLSAH